MLRTVPTNMVATNSSFPLNRTCNEYDARVLVASSVESNVTDLPSAATAYVPCSFAAPVSGLNESYVPAGVNVISWTILPSCLRVQVPTMSELAPALPTRPRQAAVAKTKLAKIVQNRSGLGLMALVLLRDAEQPVQQRRSSATDNHGASYEAAGCRQSPIGATNGSRWTSTRSAASDASAATAARSGPAS